MSLNLSNRTRVHFLRNLSQLCLATCSANILKHAVFREFVLKIPT